jgi:hypothetical protein
MNYHFNFSIIQYIETIIISANNNSLAIIFRCTHSTVLTINLISLTNSKEIKKIEICSTKTTHLNADMMSFNTTGDIFVWLDDTYVLYVLQKKNNQWFLVSRMFNTGLINVKIMPTEKHLLFNSNKCYINDFMKPRYTKENISFLHDHQPKIKENISFLHDHKPRIIDRIDTRYSVWGVNLNNYSCYIHPTGLAIINFDEEAKQVKIISPTKKSFLGYHKDTLCRLCEKFINNLQYFMESPVNFVLVVWLFMMFICIFFKSSE